MSRRPELKKVINKKLLIVCSVVLVIALVVAGVLIYGFSPSTVIADGVYVNSLSVGGLTMDEATEKISQKFNEEYFNKTVKINHKGKSFELNLKDVLSVNVEDTVKVVFENHSNVFSKFLKKDKVTVPFVLNTNSASVKNEILEFFMETENIKDAFEFNSDFTSVNIDITKFSKAVDVEATLNIVYENARNDKYDAVEALTLEKGDDMFAESIYNSLIREPVNATVGVKEDKSTYIIPEIIGIEADKTEFMKLYKENKGKFTIKVKPVYPEITVGDLKIEFYQDVLGSYTSTYNSGLVNRTKNVTLAANFVNGTIIAPGENFSYNKVVGPRNYARGFKDATVYTSTGTEEGVGGGICQVSSTIYCAQLRANLKTVSRSNHSYTVSYVPLAQDATVVYGSLDYVFKNDTNYPIKIQAIASGGKLTVKILGTKTDKSLTYDVVSIRHSTTPRGEKKTEDPTLPVGTSKVKQNGQDGAVVSSYKIYYKNGKEYKRELVSKDVYRPLNRIILEGTKPVEPGESTIIETEVPVTENPDAINPDNPMGDIVTDDIPNAVEVPNDNSDGVLNDGDSDTDIDNSTEILPPIVEETEPDVNTENDMSPSVPESTDSAETDNAEGDEFLSDTGL